MPADEILLAQALCELDLAAPAGAGPPADAFGSRRGTPVRARARDGSPVVTFLSAVRPDEVMSSFGASPLALAIVSDPRRQRGFDPVIIREAFGTTPAEAQVAARLAQGCTIAEIAERQHVQISTIRTQVRSLLSKLGARRQSEVVRILMSMPSLEPR